MCVGKFFRSARYRYYLETCASITPHKDQTRPTSVLFFLFLSYLIFYISTKGALSIPPPESDYNPNGIVDHSYLPNIHKYSGISREINQKNVRIYLCPENWCKRISEYICIKILLRTNIQIYLYPKSWHERIS